MSAPTPYRPIRRHLLPVAVVGLIAFARIGLYGMERYEFMMDLYFNAFMLFQFAVMLGILVLCAWFVFLSGYPWKLKAAGVGLVGGAIVGFLLVAQKVEFDGQMRPTVRFRWEASEDEILANHLATSPKATDGVDLTIGLFDSPAFRGPAGDGIAAGVTIADNWTTATPTILWKHPAGTGHAGIAVAGNSLVTLEQRQGDEVVVCYDKTTGHERWTFAYSARFTHSEPMGGDGPRTTPVIHGGDVYTLGAKGDLHRLDGKTGMKKWHANILADADAPNLEWGLSASVTIWGGLIIVNPGAKPGSDAKTAVAAYDTATGKKLWANGSAPAAYASPQIVTLAGKEQVLVFDAVGLGGYDPATGAELWRHPWKTDMGMNSAQPIAVGPNRLFVSSEKSNGGAVVEVTLTNGKWTTKEVWKTRALAARFSCPVKHGEHIYGLSDGRLVCVDAATGKRLWADGSYGNGQIVLAGNLLLITAETGSLGLVAADPTEFRALGKLDVFDTRTWNVPALAGNVLYMRNHREIAAVKLP